MFKICQTCGIKFQPKRKDQKYCSAACKQKMYRQRKKAVSIKKRNTLTETAENYKKILSNIKTLNPENVTQKYIEERRLLVLSIKQKYSEWVKNFNFPKDDRGYGLKNYWLKEAKRMISGNKEEQISNKALASLLDERTAKVHKFLIKAICEQHFRF